MWVDLPGLGNPWFEGSRFKSRPAIEVDVDHGFPSGATQGTCYHFLGRHFTVYLWGLFVELSTDAGYVVISAFDYCTGISASE
jgi:hypothetical protein